MAKLIPILYSTLMVQAKLAGRKTQTRRTSKLEKINILPNTWELIGMNECHVNGKKQPAYCACFKRDTHTIDIPCPYGQPGDILWTREKFAIDITDEWPIGEYVHFANANGRFHQLDSLTWKPSIHMPYAACRMWDVVVSITVERLHDISEADAIAEGIAPHKGWDSDNREGIYYKNYGKEGYVDMVPKDSYQSLWIAINGQKSYDLNPWVWVITFKPTTKP